MRLTVAGLMLLPAVVLAWPTGQQQQQARQSTVLLCGLDEHCPSGQQCVEQHVSLGSAYCKSSQLNTRRTGSCGVGQQGGFGGRSCQDNADCAANQRCCSQSTTGLAQCQQAVPCSTTPRLIIFSVTVLRDGSQTPVSPPPNLAIKFIGSMALVQSNCRNILFDSGGYADRLAVLTALRDKAGLYADDIDFVITSHGHPDHFGNVNLFPRASNQLFFAFTLDKEQYNVNPLFANQTFYPFDDRNLEVIATIGHTAQDVSLIVRNSNLGSVALVGDLLLDENDFDQQNGEDNVAILANRRKVICDLGVDYILPGHAPLFRVTPQYRQRSFQC